MGIAECMGDGLFILVQPDEDTGEPQSVILNRGDLEAMLATT